MYVPRFLLRQRMTLGVNRFEIVALGPDGSQGGLLCMAQQKRFALKELVTFFADEARTQPVFSFQARNVMDLAGTYDIFDGAGQVIGTFRKDFGASLLRTTYHVEGQGWQGSGTERSQLTALLRRFSDFDFFPIHFDYVDSMGNPLFTIDRQPKLRDNYEVNVTNGHVDFRIAAAVAVAMDVLLQR